MRRPWTSATGLGLVTVAAVYAGCGGRTELQHGPPKPDCVVDADCFAKVKGSDLCHPVTCEKVEADAGAGGADGADGGSGAGLVARCVKGTPVDCDDHDPCTTDTCVGTTGLCTYGPSTPDRDGDGHRAPLPGFVAGAPGSCGDDCDDTNPSVHPGATDTCGVDNDCDGLAEQNPTYVPIAGADVLVSSDVPPAGTAGLGFDGTAYLASYSGTKNGSNIFLSGLTQAGALVDPPGEQPLTLTNADATGGAVVWIGDRYGIAWEDRRSGDYQVYFSILDSSGSKKHADTQLTFTQGFSINPSMAWNGTEFLVVWQDDRDVGTFNLFGQRLDADSTPIGTNVPLTMDSADLGNESPTIASGLKTAGIAWGFGNAASHLIMFQAFSPDLGTPMSPPIPLTDGTTAPVYPSVVWSQDRYVVVWYDTKATPAAIYAAAVGEDGTVLVPTTAITHPGPFRSRTPFLRPLGDRLILAFADDRDQNGGYEIYTRMIAPDLSPIGGELRVTSAPHDSLDPIVAGGPEGFVGILFRDDRDGGHHDVYFTRLGCVAGDPP